MPIRNDTILRKRSVPSKVQFNNQTFYAKYERVKRANLLPNVKI